MDLAQRDRSRRIRSPRSETVPQPAKLLEERRAVHTVSPKHKGVVRHFEFLEIRNRSLRGQTIGTLLASYVRAIPVEGQAQALFKSELRLVSEVTDSSARIGLRVPHIAGTW